MRLRLGLVQQSCTCRLHHCSVFVEVEEFGNATVYKFLTLHMILWNSEMTLYTGQCIPEGNTQNMFDTVMF